jgi:pimeloyl-ACP methyl ester carboxylesterase
VILRLPGGQGAAAELDICNIKSASGISLAAVQAGNTQGPQILFIHGFSQSYLSWEKQLSDPDLLRRFQLVAFDLRGHGRSDKPSEVFGYTSEAWADDIAAVIAATGGRRPVLVAWSMGGAVVASYVKYHGVSSIAGINLVASPAIFSGVVDFGPDDRRKTIQRQFIAGMQSEDIEANRKATRTFVRMLTAKARSKIEMEVIIAYNMLTPAYARRALIAGSSEWYNFADLVSALTVPVCVTHGTADDLLPYENSVSTKEAISGSAISTYEGIGHAPFLEDSSRFDRELVQFAVTVNTPPI